MLRLTVLLVLVFVAGPVRAGDLQQLLQLIDYVGVDYAEAVSEGRVINAAEYAEMQDFAAGILQQSGDLPANSARAGLQQQAGELSRLIGLRAPASSVAALTTAMRLAIVEAYKVTVVPRQAPDLARGADLYAGECAACHGDNGAGDGPMAAGMQPPPIDFRDRERYRQRTLYGLYSTITQGVADTAMQAYHELPAADRWALAFFVGALGAEDVSRDGADVLLNDTDLQPLLNVQAFTVTTPADAEAEFGPQGAQLVAWLRANPARLFTGGSPLQFSRHRLDDVLSVYRQGERERAYQLAVEAYLEGFELAEQGLNAVDADLRLEIETAMTGLRGAIREAVPPSELADEIVRIKGLLDTAVARLDGLGLSGATAFTSAFFILVREGLEALLVVAALAAFLVKTGHRANLRYLHYGWIGALAAGLFTWLASVYLIEISGAGREITEGAAALLATVVLFYVGFWLHDKTSAAQWQRFIETSVRRALSAGTLWGLAGLSFIAVYREVFETILFYQALWVQTDADGRSMTLGGFGAGVLVLAVLAWVIMRYSARLPLRQFFSLTGMLMFVLALVFAGKGVAALQEAGYIPVSPVSFPRVELLGIYPNLQGLSLQLALLLLALFLWYGIPGKRRETVS